MIWIIIAAVIVIGSVLYSGLFRRDWDEALGVFIIGSFVAVAVVLLILLAGRGFSSHSHELKSIDRAEIVLMSDNLSTNGQWSLFGGSVATSGEFYYYTDRNGVNRLESADADISEIRQDSSQPYVEYIEYKGKWTFWTYRVGDFPKYVFHIPEGSINHSIRLDGE